MTSLLSFFRYVNEQIFAVPATLLFLIVGIIFTFVTRLVQVRGLPRLIYLIKHGIPQEHDVSAQRASVTMSPVRALFTAMGTTIGMGNMVGPTIAIMMGGPGALFWLVVYIFFGSVTKLVEVVFAIKTRVTMSDGHVVGGPMYYLKEVHPLLAYWYAGVMIFLFAGWSSVQSNTLATIFAQEGVPPWSVGLGLALIVLLIVYGGAQRVGEVVSKLVPVMFILYISFAFFILAKDFAALKSAIMAVFHAAFNPSAPIAGFVGVAFTQMVRSGICRGIYITEAGLGSSSISHAVASVKHPIDQGILALFSATADATLCTISGLLVLVTGVWLTGDFRSTLIYEVFKLHAPAAGSVALLISLSLFVLTTIIGNSFNGMQTFGSLTDYRWVRVYALATAVCIFLGSMMQARLAWEMMDTLLTLVAIPNLIGILVLAYKNPRALRYWH